MGRRAFFLTLLLPVCSILIILIGFPKLKTAIGQSGTAGNINHRNKYCFPYARGEQVPLQGQIVAATNFGHALKTLSSGRRVKRVVEIGTWYGGGSTTAFVEGLLPKSNCVENATHRCCEAFVVTLEIFEEAWAHARLYHQSNPVHCVLGSTVPVEDMLKEEEIPTEEKSEHFDLYYLRDKSLMQKMDPKLRDICKSVSPDVVLIDGNEYTGWAEFIIVMKFCNPKWLALHDYGTLKTKKVEEFLSSAPSIYELEQQGTDGETKWAIFRMRHA